MISPPPSDSAGLDRLRGDLLTLSRRLPHDLGAPLGCLTTVAGAWQELPGEIAARSVAEAAGEIAALGARLSLVLRASATPAEARPLRMDEIVWNAGQRLETRRMKSEAALDLPADWPACTGVPAWTEIVWEELLANSLRHAGPRPRLALGWEHTDDGILHWLRDSGPGVAPAKRGLLFHPFERLHELGAPRGYGLPIVRRLVELQGGRCGYRPEPEPGGTFFFTLPAVA